MRKKNKPTWEEIKANPERLKYFRKNFAIASLRRASYRWPGRYNCNNLNKIARNEYFCNICGLVTGKKDSRLDHIIPVVSIDGFNGFDDYIDRLLCIEEGFQRICKDCHNEKSKKENALRPKKIRKKS